jgi:hypothetical protein
MASHHAARKGAVNSNSTVRPHRENDWGSAKGHECFACNRVVHKVNSFKRGGGPPSSTFCASLMLVKIVFCIALLMNIVR